MVGPSAWVIASATKRKTIHQRQHRQQRQSSHRARRKSHSSRRAPQLRASLPLLPPAPVSLPTSKQEKSGEGTSALPSAPSLSQLSAPLAPLDALPYMHPPMPKPEADGKSPNHSFFFALTPTRCVLYLLPHLPVLFLYPLSHTHAQQPQRRHLFCATPLQRNSRHGICALRRLQRQTHSKSREGPGSVACTPHSSPFF